MHSLPVSSALQSMMVRIRRDLHQHPERSWHEEGTAASVMAELRALGLQLLGHLRSQELDIANPKQVRRIALDKASAWRVKQAQHVGGKRAAAIVDWAVVALQAGLRFGASYTIKDAGAVATKSGSFGARKRVIEDPLAQRKQIGRLVQPLIDRILRDARQKTLRRPRRSTGPRTQQQGDAKTADRPPAQEPAQATRATRHNI